MTSCGERARMITVATTQAAITRQGWATTEAPSRSNISPPPSLHAPAKSIPPWASGRSLEQSVRPHAPVRRCERTACRPSDSLADVPRTAKLIAAVPPPDPVVPPDDEVEDWSLPPTGGSCAAGDREAVVEALLDLYRDGNLRPSSEGDRRSVRALPPVPLPVLRRRRRSHTGCHQEPGVTGPAPGGCRRRRGRSVEDKGGGPRRPAVRPVRRGGPRRHRAQAAVPVPAGARRRAHPEPEIPARTGAEALRRRACRNGGRPRHQRARPPPTCSHRSSRISTWSGIGR